MFDRPCYKSRPKAEIETEDNASFENGPPIGPHLRQYTGRPKLHI